MKEEQGEKKSVHWLDSSFFVQECLVEKGRLQHFLENQAGLKYSNIYNATCTRKTRSYTQQRKRRTGI